MTYSSEPLTDRINDLERYAHRVEDGMELLRMATVELAKIQSTICRVLFAHRLNHDAITAELDELQRAMEQSTARVSEWLVE